jgi:hypothetical protein
MKIRYTCQRENGFTFSEIFTIEQLEVGEAETWFAFNFVDRTNVHRDLFTSYKDEEKTDIYENDIVIKNMGSKGYSEPMLVVFENGGFRLSPNRSILHDDLVMHLLNSAFKVIGNKYSNPELMKLIKG